MSDHHCELNFLSRSDGSALYSIGSTVALASVNGPGDVKKSNRDDFTTHLEVVYNPATGHPMLNERVLESIIKRTVSEVVMGHMYPRTGIHITIQQMQTDGLPLATSINATCMALLNAGVQMKCTFVGITCCITKDGTIIIDPTTAQIEESDAVSTFVFENQGGDVIVAQEEGHIDTKTFDECLIKCKEASKSVYAFYRRVMDRRYNDQL